MPRLTSRSREPVPIALSIMLIAAALHIGGCSSAFYGGATGAYFVSGACSDHCIDYGGAADPPRNCGGGADAAVVVGAIVVGAALAVAGEIIKWLSHGGDCW
jgi:hypothetical protein